MDRRLKAYLYGIIGEATNKVDKEYPEIAISNARAIIATRNKE